MRADAREAVALEQSRNGGRLLAAVLQDQPAAFMQMRRRGVGDCRQGLEPRGTDAQRDRRLRCSFSSAGSAAAT